MRMGFSSSYCGYSHRSREGGSAIGTGGLVLSIIVFPKGAVLDWAITEPYQHGFNLKQGGWILIIVGILSTVLSVIVQSIPPTRRVMAS